MSKQINKMQILKKVFYVLLVLDLLGLVSAIIAFVPMFKDMVGYGQVMLVVATVISALMVAVMLFRILTKIFMIRSTSPTFSWASGRKGYIAAAKFLLLINLCSVIFCLLSVGGEGATLVNQARFYLQILASAVEMIAAFVYQRTAKKLVTSAQENCN